MPKYITPAAPKSRPAPPTGPRWQHEVKFDGWRLQVHKYRDEVALLSRNGFDITGRAPEVARAAASLRATSFLIDAELVASNEHGRPDFKALMFRRRSGRCAVCFDLMFLNGLDLRSRPLIERTGQLRALLAGAGDALVVSEAFGDASALLAECERLGLEGIVSKRIDQPYRSGSHTDWIKVKTAAWRAANRHRAEMFATKKKTKR